MTPGIAALLWCHTLAPGQLQPPLDVGNSEHRVVQQVAASPTGSSLGIHAEVHHAAAPLTDVAVVCHRTWRAVMRPWVQLRQQQGYRLHWLDPAPPRELGKALIHLRQQQPGLRYLVLVGDAPDLWSQSTPLAEDRPQVPTCYVKSQVTVRWGSTATIASDTPLSDLDGDGIPELAVGRLPVDSAAELEALIGRILRHEQDQDWGPWRRQVNFAAGSGGFGPLVDTAVEAAARTFITRHIPPSYATQLSYANWRSPYCPPLGQLRPTTTQLLSNCSAWIFIGHGLPDQLATASPQGDPLPMLTTADVLALQEKIHPDQRTPVALILACYALAYDAREDCVGEELLKTPGGPIAVIGGTRVTMPYGQALLALRLLEGWFEQRSATVGELLLRAKRQLVASDGTGRSSQWLDTMAKLFHPDHEHLHAERVEHSHLIQLLGDPLLRLHHPQTVDLQCDRECVAGGQLLVGGTSPLAGLARIELICPRDRLTFTPPRRNAWPGDTAAEEMTATFQRANQRTWAVVRQSVADGPFQLALDVPADAAGPAHVRVFVEGQAGFALGAGQVKIRALADPAPAGEPRPSRLSNLPQPTTTRE